MKYPLILRKLALLAISFLTSIFIACNPTPQSPLTIGSDLWPGFEPLYLARDLGYFDKAAIKIVEYSGISELDDAFRNQAIEMAVGTLNSTLIFAEQNPDARVWLLCDFSDGADALVAQSDIKDLKNLSGRTVGLYPYDLAKLILTRALHSVDLPIDSVEQVILESTEHQKAFADREIDAVVTFEPTRSILLERGANLLFDSRQMPGEIVDLLVGRKDLINKYSRELQVLTEGWFKALQYIQEHPDDAMQRMADRQGITKEQFIQSLEGLSFMDLSTNQALLSGENPELYEGAQRLIAFLKEQNLLEQEVDLDNLFDDRFVKRVNL